MLRKFVISKHKKQNLNNSNPIHLKLHSCDIIWKENKNGIVLFKTKICWTITFSYIFMAGVLEALTNRSTKYALSLWKDLLFMTEKRLRIKTPKTKLRNDQRKIITWHYLTIMMVLIPLQVREKLFKSKSISMC